MIATFMIALCALAITLYVQARMAAREIRRHRRMSDVPPARKMVLKHRIRNGD
jgi:hypothetical protein